MASVFCCQLCAYAAYSEREWIANNADQFQWPYFVAFKEEARPESIFHEHTKI